MEFVSMQKGHLQGWPFCIGTSHRYTNKFSRMWMFRSGMLPDSVIAMVRELQPLKNQIFLLNQYILLNYPTSDSLFF